MKHVQNYQKVNAIVKRFDEYVDDVKSALSQTDEDNEFYEVSLDGSVDGVDILPILAAYYGVKEVTSVHSDCSEYNAIWIGYRD